jgi:uncharacterized membrane protein YdbT with pleckstrin-like domain
MKLFGLAFIEMIIFLIQLAFMFLIVRLFTNEINYNTIFMSAIVGNICANRANEYYKTN